MAMVLAIFGLLVGMLMPVATTMQTQQRYRESAEKMAAAEQALIAFVMVNKRLPCPADGALLNTDPNAGFERPPGGGNCTATARGVLPWRTLGMAEADATDAWNARLTYRVPNALATGTALDATGLDPAGSGLQTFLTGTGLKVEDENAVPTNDPTATSRTGAAYVLISHGRYGGRGYNSAGIFMGSDIAPGTKEDWNRNNAALRVTPNAYFHDSRVFDDGGGTEHFDDLIAHPTIMTVLTKAQLGPRAP